MSFHNGIFSRLFSWQVQRNKGIKILAAQMDQEDSGFATGLSTGIRRDGQSTIAANIPWSNRRITGLVDPTNAQDISTLNYVSSATKSRIGTQLFGATLSNDATLPNTVLDIASGQVASDDNLTMMILGALKKTLGSWAAGTGVGALDAGFVAPSTWYHVFAIYNPTGPVVDILMSSSPTTPLLPSGYTKKRRIGSIATNASSNINQFSQNGDEFLWLTPFLDIANVGVSNGLYALSVPLGVVVNALIFGECAGNGPAVIINSPAQAAESPTTYNCTVLALSADSNFNTSIRTNTSSQVRIGVGGGGINLLSLRTFGWLDTRGK